MLVRFGPRNWIALIAVLWGLVSCSFAVVTDVTGFYAARFLLGVTQAGFFPGASVFLRGFFPPESFGFCNSLVTVATCFAMILGGPFSSLVQVVRWFGWRQLGAPIGSA